MRLAPLGHRAMALPLLVLVCLSCAPSAAQYLSPAVLKAAEAARMGNATRQQQALLFMNNDAINQARLSGYLPDSTYQAAQRQYASLNEKFAQAAAESTGAKFTVQQSTSTTYSPGTDSDYIVTTSSGDPVEQIREMQSRYNDSVNSYLQDALGEDAATFDRKNTWHNQLDVDFMADPAHVTDQQFQEIARLNNDAYTRRGAAEYERRSRMGGVEVTPDQFSDYAAEMQDFIRKKQDYLDKINKDPSSLTDPKTLAEQHRLMAQESKYTSRIQSANQLLREQEGLTAKPTPKGPPVYEITEHPNGQTSIRKRPTGTLAEMGSKRSPTNRSMTATASALANNSVQQAVTDLAESMTEASVKNPSKWGNVQSQIAQMTEDLQPTAKPGLNTDAARLRASQRMSASARSQMLDRLGAAHEAAVLEQIVSDKGGKLTDVEMQQARNQARQAGRDFQRGVADEMRQQIRSQRSLSVRADNALRNSLGVTDDMSNLRGLRGTVNRRAASLMGGMDKLGHLGTAMEVLSAAGSAYSALDNLYRARDENLTAAQMRELQRAAGQDLARLSGQGLLAGISYAVPTAGAMIGGFEMGYGAGRYVLENTAIGRAVDQAALEGFDEGFQAWESFWERFEGRGAMVAAEAERRRKLEEAYWNALRRGEIKMKPDASIEEFLRRLREGDLASVRDLFEPGPNASQATRDRLAGKKPPKKKDPNGDLEFESQTFDVAGDQAQIDEFHRLQAEGKSPIGPVVNPGREEGIVTAKPDYRARAQQFLQRSRPSASSLATPKGTDYRRQAEQINARVTAIEEERARQAAIERERARQAAIAEARRREQIRRQQIAAAQARQRQLAQQQAWARQQQLARQQQAWNSYWQTQAALQRWQSANTYNNWGRNYPAAPRDGSVMGPNYNPSPRSTYNGSEYDYYGSENPIQW